jgi:hypothetical protein
MKKSCYLFILFYSLITNAQIGVGTTNPQATLDIREANPAAPTAKAGIAISQVSILPSTGNRAGQLIYLTTSNSYYFYNGSLWQALSSGSSAIIGDVKNGYQTTDHSGWILLNGRLKSSLTTTQQTAATGLGIGINLPNTADKSIVGTSATKALNTTGGSDVSTITRDQLPDFTLLTNVAGAHSHTYYYPTYVNVNVTATYTGTVGSRITSSYGYPTDVQGNHNHITESINGGVTQTTINIQNPYIVMNGFIYLGL